MLVRIALCFLIVWPAMAGEIAVEGETMRFNGDIVVGNEVALVEALDANPQVTTLTMESRGGDVYTAMQMAKIIRNHRLSTRVTGDCLSACTVMFIGGQTREQGENGHIGFHRVQSVETGASVALEDPLYNRLTMLAWGLGVDPVRFVQWMTFASPEALYEPSREELVNARLLTN